MKMLIAAGFALGLAVAIPATARSSSDEWADKAFSKDEQARMERAVQAIELAGECRYYRMTMGDSLEEKNKDGPEIAKAVIALAYDVYGKMFDAMSKDHAQAMDLKGINRDFMIGALYGSAQTKGEAEGFRRLIAETKDMNYSKDLFNLVAVRLYRERSCALLPR